MDARHSPGYPLLPKARPVLDAIRAAFRHDWQAPLILRDDQRTPELKEFRTCAFYLVAESDLALRRGDAAAALRSRMDAMELGARVSCGGASRQWLTGRACVQIGARDSERLLPVLPPAAIRPALARLRRIRALQATFPDVLEAERVTTLALLTEYVSWRYRFKTPLATTRFAWEQLPSERWQGDWSEARSELAIWLAPKRRSLGMLDAYYRPIAEAKKPYRQRRVIQPPRDPLVDWQERPFYLDPGETNLDWQETRWQADEATLALLEIALAVEQHRVVYGQYPEHLDAIDRWLPTVSNDPWDQPIHYRRIAGHPVIYSLGPDGRDDGARPILLKNLKRQRRGDLVFGRLWEE